MIENVVRFSLIMTIIKCDILYSTKKKIVGSRTSQQALRTKINNYKILCPPINNIITNKTNIKGPNYYYRRT